MNLNGRQSKIVIIGVVLFVLIGLMPPWTYTLDLQSIHRETPAGYAWIFSSPVPEQDTLTFGIKIDSTRPVVQWLVLAAATGLGVFMTRAQTK